jgi:hypothetical protein
MTDERRLSTSDIAAADRHETDVAERDRDDQLRQEEPRRRSLPTTSSADTGPDGARSRRVSSTSPARPSKKRTRWSPS